MARVTLDVVDHVARLAHLSLSDDERRLFARQLDEILTYAESIQALDTRDVEPMSHAQTVEILREDETHVSLDRAAVLGAAPDPAEGLFRVPRVIGG